MSGSSRRSAGAGWLAPRRLAEGRAGRGILLYAVPPVSDDDFIYWQDVLDDIAAGRKAPLRCPFCQAEGLKITQKGAVTRIECTACRHFIEGKFPDAEGAPGGDGTP